GLLQGNRVARDLAACPLHHRQRRLRHAQRRHPRPEANQQRHGEQQQRATEHQRPRAMRRPLPRCERQRADRDRTLLDREAECFEQRAALLALGEVSRVALRILEVSLTGVLHRGSTNPSSVSLSMLRARKSLFFTVPRGSFFIEAISSYDSSAKWRS